MPDEPLHTCFDCGLFTRRATKTLGQYTEGDFMEIATDRREKLLTFPDVENSPIYCLNQRRDFMALFVTAKEEQGLSNGNLEQLATIVSDLLTKPHDCPDWRQHQWGASPREHREMMDRERLLKWQSNERKDDKNWRRKELVVLGFVSVVMAGAFTLLGSFIQRDQAPPQITVQPAIATVVIQPVLLVPAPTQMPE
jgi:hypothetical protein